MQLRLRQTQGDFSKSILSRTLIEKLSFPLFFLNRIAVKFNGARVPMSETEEM